MTSSSQSSHDRKNHAFIYANVKNALNVHHDACVDRVMPAMCHDAIYASHAMIASLSASYAHGRSRTKRHAHRDVSYAPRTRNASHSPMLYHTFDASYMLYSKSSKVCASNVGPKCKKGKTCIWVPKSYVTNLTGPSTRWVPKPQA
jgi:hypothetical protein